LAGQKAGQRVDMSVELTADQLVDWTVVLKADQRVVQMVDK
jgi:hypothetical protein